MQPWDEERTDYDTRGNRCPRCGREYPTHSGVKDVHVFGASDALEIGCTCDGCGLEFSELWIWDEVDKAIGLRYNSTLVKAGHTSDSDGQE